MKGKKSNTLRDKGGLKSSMFVPYKNKRRGSAFVFDIKTPAEKSLNILEFNKASPEHSAINEKMFDDGPSFSK